MIKTQVKDAPVGNLSINESYMMSLMAIDWVLSDSQWVNRYVLCDLLPHEVFLLNQVLQNQTKSQKLAQLVLQDKLEFGTLYEWVRNRVSSLDSLSLQKLKRLKFYSIDPVLNEIGINHEPREHYLLQMLNDYFASVPDSDESLVLNSIRSFARFLELKTYFQESDNNEVIAAFTAEATLLYCIDSVQELDSLAKKYALPFWNEIRITLITSNQNVDVKSEYLRWYREILNSLNAWTSLSPEGDLWLIASKSKNGSNTEFSLESILNLKGLDQQLDTMRFSLEDSSMLHVRCTSGEKDTVIIIASYKDFWLHHWIQRETDYTPDKEIQSQISKYIPLPFFTFGVIANQALFTNHFLKKADVVNDFPPIDPGKTLGFELAFLGEGLMFQLRYAAQSQWLNWGSANHFDYHSLQLFLLLPIYQNRYFQTYVGYDYEYAQQSLQVRAENAFFGTPTNAPKILTNNVHGAGLNSKSVFSWKGMYVSFQWGYRYDLSDSRWSYRNKQIQELSPSRLSGIHYGIGLGISLGETHERVVLTR